ncbi:MAG: hypothetical protein AAGI34_08775 [Pseudomonadota bacterium]
MAEPAPPTHPANAYPANALRRYLAIVLGVALATAVSLAGYAWYLGPPEGDLVRIQGGSERHFGWQGEAVGFASDAYDRLSAEELLAGADPGELLVFGDSFSLPHQGGVSWINTVVEATGLRARFVRILDFRIVRDYLRSEAYRLRPPRAVIVQSVERALVKRAKGVFDATAPCTPPPAPAPLSVSPNRLDRASFARRTAFESLDEMLSWGALAARPRFSRQERVIEVDLTRDDLFSHRAANRLLLFGDDVSNHLASDVGASDLAAARCGLAQTIAAAEGLSPVYLAIAPDKRTLYAPYIATPLPAKAADLFVLAEEALGASAIDLRQPLAEAAAAGVRDLYWPGDTHWGAAGHRIAGERVAAHLRAPRGGSD